MGLNTLKAFWSDESGATAIEYGLLVALLAIACIAGFRAVSGASGGSWDNTSTEVIDAMTP